MIITQSFQQQIIADSIQTGLSILPILPIWKHLPSKLFGVAHIPCQDMPPEAFEILKPKPKQKKSILKRLMSVEGLFIASMVLTLITVIVIDSDDGPSSSQRSTRGRYPPNYDNYAAQQAAYRRAQQAAYQQQLQYQSMAQAAYQASTLPPPQPSPQRGNNNM